MAFDIATVKKTWIVVCRPCEETAAGGAKTDLDGELRGLVVRISLKDSSPAGMAEREGGNDGRDVSRLALSARTAEEGGASEERLRLDENPSSEFAGLRLDENPSSECAGLRQVENPWAGTAKERPRQR